MNERLGDSMSNVPNIAVTHFLLELQTKIRETADDIFKAMKSSPLLRPFCVSEFWGFSLLNI